MKWIVVTAKHHDGFCMFETELTDYNIVDATPFGRDPLKELAEACSREDIKLGFYYSQTLDWHHPNGMGNDWDFSPANQNFTSYLREYVKPQLRELLTNYGSVAVIWFDIGTPTPELALELKNYVRGLQSETIICGRIRGGIRPSGARRGVGDYTVMGDNMIPDEKIEDDWETPATINDTWGYKSYDHNWKSSGELIKKLVDIVSKGGNYLLNVGPTAEGLIPEPSVKRLREIGEWLRINGESIYETKASPTKICPSAPYRCTCRPDKIYIHVFGWPWNGRFNVSGITETVKQVYLLSNGEKLDFEQKKNMVTINVPDKAPDPVDTVLVLDRSILGQSYLHLV